MLELSFQNAQEVVDQNNSASLQEKKQIQMLQDVIVKPASTSSETTTFQEPRCSSSIAFQEPSFSSTLHDSSMRVIPQVSKTYLDFTLKRKKIQKSENDVYVSPSTGNTLHVLENAEYGLATPIRKYYNLRKETPVTPNVSNLTSRTSSISDISCAKSLLCPLSNEEICAIYDTQAQNNQSSLTNLNISTIYGNDLNPDASNNNYTPNPSEKICSIYDTQTQNEQSSLTYLNIPANSAKDFEPDSSDDNYAPNSFDLETDSSYSDDSDGDDSVITYYENSSEIELVQILENTQCTENNNFDEWEDINDTKPDFDEFTDNCRPNIPDNTITPADFYSLFVTDEIIEQMVINTNNYAQDLISNLSNLKPKSRLRAWTPTTPEEMKKFLGVLLAMGLVRIPRLNDYWLKRNIYNNKYISSVMTRDRFLLILKFWHFSQESPNDTDKLKKIRDTFNKILEKMQTLLEPGQYLIIDESMIPWRGRLKFRQYIKNKSHKYGVKLYKLCTPEGYTKNCIIYTGKGDNGRETNHGKETVLRLIKGLENNGRIIITDNFYNSIDLAEELIRKKTFMCGTLRPNRKGNPKKIISIKLKRGQIVGKMNPNGVRIIKWTDKRPVHMISTCRNHNLTLKSTGKTNRITGNIIKKPQCVITYNENKKGIDFNDQMSSYYSSLKRGVKWFRKVMMEILFGTVIINSWVLYNHGKPVQMPKKNFMEAIIEALIQVPILTETANECAAMPKTNHTFENKGLKRRNCAGCYNKLRATLNSKDAQRKTKKIKSYCAECNKGYCAKCFYENHL
ncbi:unnamed protein product [Parnassius mnemosyne]|uniref:PiggyBac transposable element-derived protein domain-containing protein n=1 Tax=Parnassius mnemosyne TaxID=213953 RepID=A0AAV1L4K3_9NEOP